MNVSVLSVSLPTAQAALVLAIAALLDFLIGDPWNWLHPVQVMGWLIGKFSSWGLRRWKAPRSQKLAGVVLGLGLVLGSGAVGWGMGHLAQAIHPLLGGAVQAVLLASCFAARSLRNAAADVLQPLAAGELEKARSHLSRYVGRDTENLSEPEMLRAVLETVTENAVDGAMAPLFWAIAGAFTPLGSVSLALAYKASSTLDSMVGYKDPPYTHLGWFSARLDDGLTWLPCRLTVITLGLLSGQPRRVWRICRRDAPQDSSPNSGWSECVYAAILGVQVGGVNVYRGKIKQKPLLGDPQHPITPQTIRQALQFTRYGFMVWIMGAVIGLLALPKPMLWQI